MKIKFLLCNVFIVFLFTSCVFFSTSNSEPIANTYFTPVIITRAQLESSVVIENPKTTIKAGKIYIKDNIMFVNDINKGFQIYNYSNPSNPIAVSYINFPGATDIAIRNNTLYVNQAVDLVSVNYNSTSNTIIINSRVKNAFPQKISPDGFIGNPSDDQIIINWIPNN